MTEPQPPPICRWHRSCLLRGSVRVTRDGETMTVCKPHLPEASRQGWQQLS